MISVIIPAHNESAVIARILRAILDGRSPAIDVTVACNGCSDGTADVARGFSPAVRVVETDIPNKSHALNLGDQASQGFPRVYADADIVITGDGVRALTDRLERGDVLAVAPTANVNVEGCSWPVRRYFAVRARLPSAREGIGGSGVYAVSERGRKRFGQFPGVIADDTYVCLQFKPHERATLSDVRSTVFAPRTLSRLLSVRTRAYMGTIELSRRFPELSENKGEPNHLALAGLFVNPALWPGLLIYCCINLMARCKARILLRKQAPVWHRDDTSRVALSADSFK